MAQVISGYASPKNSLNTRRKILYALIFIVALLVIVLIFAKIFAPKSNKDVSDSFISSVLSDNAVTSYKYTSSDFKSSTPLSVWEKNVKAVSLTCDRTFDISAYKLYNVASASESFTTNGPYGKCFMSVDLINSSGTWLVNSFIMHQ